MATFTFTNDDGGALIDLNNGLVVIRRKKHEWRASLDPNDKARFARGTDSINGSKFRHDWTVEQIATWTARQVLDLGWTLENSPTEIILDAGHVIGYSCGEAVTHVKIELSSTNIHAYPYKE